MTQPEPCSSLCRRCGIRDSVLFGSLDDRDLLLIQNAIDEGGPNRASLPGG
ncbi:hypothetical protein [Thiohalomonas denitrificans]|uniref:hypothetical protein n=1 Tax=Thiohalomonas denitrificans TaxID=415747 RepID=UPI0026EEEC8F|nr:hypothetical protein [Thiohalomonas denitrificans]